MNITGPIVYALVLLYAIFAIPFGFNSIKKGANILRTNSIPPTNDPKEIGNPKFIGTGILIRGLLFFILGCVAPLSLILKITGAF